MFTQIIWLFAVVVSLTLFYFVRHPKHGHGIHPAKQPLLREDNGLPAAVNATQLATAGSQSTHITYSITRNGDEQGAGPLGWLQDALRIGKAQVVEGDDAGVPITAKKKVRNVGRVIHVTKTLDRMAKYRREYNDAIDGAPVDPSHKERQESVRRFACTLREKSLPNEQVARLTIEIFSRLDQFYDMNVQSTKYLITDFLDSAEGVQYIQSIGTTGAAHTELFGNFLSREAAAGREPPGYASSTLSL